MAETKRDADGSGFEQLGLKPDLLQALNELGYEEPTPVQKASLPALLSGEDVLGQAATGTGKTAAFALPILNRITPGECGPFETCALIVVPTRELAMQVAEAVHSYGKRMGVSVLPVYGGQDIGAQLRRLKRGTDVVIATPGRALDHIRRKTLKLHKVQTVVLDEADEMLDLGFAEDLETLLNELPEERQTALFSATLPPRIAAIAEKHLRNPVRVRIAPERTTAGSLPRIRQTAYIVPRAQKELALGRVLDVEGPRSAIIFCRTRLEVDRLTETLSGHGYEATGLHGGMTQEQRDRALKRFKSHKLELLIATDVAARGLDVENLSHVINFDLPTSPEAYVHRIGRTGRAGKEGVAISILEPREHRLLKNIERVTRQPIEIGRVPTVVDLRARKLELTRTTVEAALEDGQLDQFRSIVEQLATEADPLDVAAAAISALHAATNPAAEEDEADIPEYRPKAPAARTRYSEDGGGDRKRSPARGREDRAGGYARTERAPREERGERGAARGPRQRSFDEAGRIFIGVGKAAGVRPADLVGAIANEAGISSQEIGAIQIADHYAFVEVPEHRVDDVIDSLRHATIRGRTFKVDRDRRR